MLRELIQSANSFNPIFLRVECNTTFVPCNGGGLNINLSLAFSISVHLLKWFPFVLKFFTGLNNISIRGGVKCNRILKKYEILIMLTLKC